MKIIALEFYKNGEMREAFALGGSLPEAEIDQNKTYPSSLQNYLIDTGNEVILVDTGLPIETRDFEKTPGMMLYIGEKTADFVTALHDAGYQPEDVDKVVITHKHPDHSGEIRLFNHAKVYISAIEAEALNLQGDNIVKVEFEDGAYKNFEHSKKIAEGITMLPAYGHTSGNSIVIVKDADLHYMIHGDISYTDEALRRNALSVVFEDKQAAGNAMGKVREFIKNNHTVYLSTHTPEALAALENKTVMELS